jgi:carotenoid cleavage dioxygenase-like enzyme
VDAYAGARAPAGKGELRGPWLGGGRHHPAISDPASRSSQNPIHLVAYEDPTIIDALYLDETGPRGSIPPNELRRYVLDLAGGAVRWEKLAEGTLELPRIDYGRLTRATIAARTSPVVTATGSTGWSRST